MIPSKAEEIFGPLAFVKKHHRRALDALLTTGLVQEVSIKKTNENTVNKEGNKVQYIYAVYKQLHVDLSFSNHTIAKKNSAHSS